MCFVVKVRSFNIWRWMLLVSIYFFDFRGVYNLKYQEFTIADAGPIVLLSRFHAELQVFHDPQTLPQNVHRMCPCAVYQMFLALVKSKKLGTYMTYVNCFENNHPI